MTQGEMKPAWSNPVPYDLTRTLKGARLPEKVTNAVPESSSAHVIYRVGQGNIGTHILAIGETGPRSNATPHGLRGRLASAVAHSASQEMAADISNGNVQGEMCVIWFETTSKSSAKELQDALLTLFRQEYGHSRPTAERSKCINGPMNTWRPLPS
jgi:hypothetical protein